MGEGFTGGLCLQSNNTFAKTNKIISYYYRKVSFSVFMFVCLKCSISDGTTARRTTILITQLFMIRYDSAMSGDYKSSQFLI